MAAITALTLLGYDMTSFAHLNLRIFLPFFSADPLNLSGWMGTMFRSLQRRSGLWLGLSRTLTGLSPSLGCVLWVIALLDNEYLGSWPRLLMLRTCLYTQVHVHSLLASVAFSHVKRTLSRGGAVLGIAMVGSRCWRWCRECVR